MTNVRFGFLLGHTSMCKSLLWCTYRAEMGGVEQWIGVAHDSESYAIE